MRYLITSLLIVSATTVMAQDSPADRIAPYLTDTALGVARIDLETLDVDAAFEKFGPFLGMIQRDSDNVHRQVISNLKTLQERGFREIYVVFDLLELRNNGAYIVMPIPEGVEMPEGGGANGVVLDGVSISGSPRIVEYFQNEPTVLERPGLAAAFEPVADAPIQVVLAPTADQRRVLREMLPDLSGKYGNITGAELAAGLEWAALGLEIDPELAVALTIQSESEQGASTLKQVITAGLRQASMEPAVLAAFPMASLLVGSLIPKQNGRQLVITPESALKVTSEALAKLVGVARQDANRAQTANNLKQFGLAMHNFHATYNSLPPSASYADNGKPLLSWRVFLLPYLEESALYEQFHLDEPWDSEHNKKLIEKMPDVFKSPRTPTEPGMTVFQILTGKGLLFEGKAGKKFSDTTDGTSNTIMIVETTAEAAVPWTKPDDVEVDPEMPLAGLVEGRDGFWTTFADGSANFISNKAKAETVYDAMTRAGGEVLEREDLQPE